MNSYPQIILASASPRRAELLDQMGAKYTIHAVDVDERRVRSRMPGTG